MVSQTIGHISRSAGCGSISAGMPRQGWQALEDAEEKSIVVEESLVSAFVFQGYLDIVPGFLQRFHRRSRTRRSG